LSLIFKLIPFYFINRKKEAPEKQDIYKALNTEL